MSYDERVKINFDHPRSIDFELLETHLKALKNGKTVQQPVYSFVKHNRTGDTILTHPRKVMIVEGILILTNPELREMFDIKIFVHADSDERLIRRLKRDISERGRDLDEVLARYQSQVLHCGSPTLHRHRWQTLLATRACFSPCLYKWWGR